MQKRVIFVTIGAIFVLILAIVGYFLMPLKTAHNLKLPSAKSSEIVAYLQDKNYSVGVLDTLFLKTFTKPIKGWCYISKTNLPRYKFLLEIGAYRNHYIPISIIPGETTYFVLKDIAKELNLSEKNLKIAYKDLAYFKEGNFIANTYNVPIYYKERDVINYLLKLSYKEHNKLAKIYNLKVKSNSYKEFIIIASIIQKEAANTKEMPLIASVIYNRLEKKMRLQMDGALNYGKYSHTKITKERIKQDKTTYNTYKHKGIPKVAVCNVSIGALKASLEPAKTNYLYFMKKDKTSHSFSVNYKEHIKNIHIRKQEIDN